jgi:hypothetical protein
MTLLQSYVPIDSSSLTENSRRFANLTNPIVAHPVNAFC